jgi:hypothetical protein
MERQLYEPEVHDKVRDAPRLSTADLVISAERATTIERSSRTATDGASPLFEADEAQNLRSRWEKIQIGFVDEPRKSVEQADELVAGVMKRLAEVFADERQKLEQEWAKGDQVSTEDLRVALRRYRSFFDRLLSV